MTDPGISACLRGRGVVIGGQVYDGLGMLQALGLARLQPSRRHGAHTVHDALIMVTNVVPGPRPAGTPAHASDETAFRCEYQNARFIKASSQDRFMLVPPSSSCCRVCARVGACTVLKPWGPVR